MINAGASISKRSFVATVDPAELAVRLCEANYGLRRPSLDPREARRQMDSDVREAWLRSAKAAADYFVEIINAAAPGEVTASADDFTTEGNA